MTHRKKASVLNKELYKVKNTSKLIQNWCRGEPKVAVPSHPTQASQRTPSLQCWYSSSPFLTTSTLSYLKLLPVKFPLSLNSLSISSKESQFIEKRTKNQLFIIYNK